MAAAASRVDLPEAVPVFPLPGVLLLPRAQLPLHIFEPRYRAMIRDVLESNGMLAMIQPLDTPEGSPGPRDPLNPPIYPVGCLGAVTAARRSEDGRYYINLTGICRFRIVRELPLKDGYRRVEVDYSEFEADRVEASDPIERDRLIAALSHYLSSNDLGADWSTVASLHSESLVNTLAMTCPFGPSEKQAILESRDLTHRAEVLTALLEMGSLTASKDGAVRH